MELIIAVVAGALGTIVAADIKAWMPWLTKRLIQAAARRLPLGLRERFTEEWHADVGDTPGVLAKLVVACGFLLASDQMRAEHLAKRLGVTPAGYPARILRAFILKSIAVLALLFMLPMLLAIALAVRMDGGPVFYIRSYVGRDGRSFGYLRFRTCTFPRDADGARDPRVTRVGRILRASRFDDLPQFINVLRGDMDLVGPRPMRQEKLDDIYGPDAVYYTAVRPGITGPWQLSGRLHESYRSRAETDVAYVRNASLRGDLLILWRSVCVLLRSRGAY